MKPGYKKLTDEQKDKFIATLQGTALGVQNAIDLIGLDEDDYDADYLEEVVVECGYERCCECDWWCECGELVDADGEEQPCDGCRPPAID